MTTITAASVKTLRERTGLPLMDCKKALIDADGDQDEAVNLLRKGGAKLMAKRSDRDTGFGRIGVFASIDPGVGAMVELKCESSPVTQNEDFIQLAEDLARQLATGPGASAADDLLDQLAPSKPDRTLRDIKDGLVNRIREVFNVGRMIRIDGSCGGYSHNASTVSGVLIGVEGGNADAAKDISMHIAAFSPKALHSDELDQEMVDKERSIQREKALAQGKPDKIVDKIVDGQMRSFFAEHALIDQPFVKEPKISVGKFAAEHNMKILRYIHWVLGQSD